MKILKKMAAVLIYLLLLAFLLNFDLRKLFDLRQLLLVIFGMVILYIPSLSKDAKKRINLSLLGNTALLAGTIQTFVLLFTVLSGTQQFETVFQSIAMSFRSLLYGFCIWAILHDQAIHIKTDDKVEYREEKEDVKGNDGIKTQNMAEEKREMTIEECSLLLKERGLSKRETEVTLLVTKGMSNVEIAAKLYISETTVKKHMSNIFGKLEISRREEIKDILFGK